VKSRVRRNGRGRDIISAMNKKLNLTLFCVILFTGCVPEEMQKAGKAFAREDYARTIGILSRYLDSDAASANAKSANDQDMFFRSVAFFYRGQSKRGCCRMFDPKRMPDYEESLQYGCCACDSGASYQTQDIVQDYLSALSLCPDAFYASYHLGLELLSDGQVKSAQAAFKDAWLSVSRARDASLRNPHIKQHVVDEYIAKICYFYCLLLAVDNDKPALRKTYEEMRNDSHRMTEKQRYADGLFRALVAGEEKPGLLNDITCLYSNEVSIIEREYFDCFNKKELAHEKRNLRLLMDKRYPIAEYRFVDEIIDLSRHYDLPTRSVEYHTDFLIVRHVAPATFAKIKDAAIVNMYKSWETVSSSEGIVLHSAKKQRVVFSGRESLQIEYATKQLPFGRMSILVYSPSKQVLYCVVCKETDFTIKQ